MKKLDITKKDIAPLILFMVSMALMITGILLKSLVVVAGVTGLVLPGFYALIR